MAPHHIPLPSLPHRPSRPAAFVVPLLPAARPFAGRAPLSRRKHQCQRRVATVVASAAGNSRSQSHDDSDCIARNRNWSLALLSSALALLAPGVGAAHAKPKTVITMTDQVPNFTLPSQERKLEADNADRPMLLRVGIFTAKFVVPPVALAVIAVWAVRRIVQRAQQKQLRDFQTQLSSFNSMLELDGAAGSGSSAPSAADAYAAYIAANKPGAAAAASKDGKKEEEAQAKEEDLSAKVQLDLFSSSDSKRDAPAPDGATKAVPVEVVGEADAAGAADVAANPRLDSDVRPEDSPFEKAVVDALYELAAPDARDSAAVAEALVKAGDRAGLSAAQQDAMKAAVASRMLGNRLDLIVAALPFDLNPADDRRDPAELQAMMAPFARLHGVLATFAPLGVDAQRVTYARPDTDKTTNEEVYRNFTIYVLSNNFQHAAYIETLDTLQRILGIEDAAAEDINTQIAKGLFQIAVSSAMVDGALSNDDKAILDDLKSSFASFINNSDADNIVSEVGAMRAMYSLQQLLQKTSDLEDDDIVQLRKMCSDLGVDIDDMLSNADALGDSLGSEAKGFVDSLRQVLNKTPKTEV